jgi:rod shape-determining protein MreC
LRGSRRTRLTLVLLLLTAFTLTALDYNSAQSGPLAALRRGIDTVFGPVQTAVGGAASSVGGALGGLPRLGSYQSDNNKLRRENDRLKGQLAAQAGLECRYRQAVALQDFVDFTDYPTVPAHVVGVGSAAGFEWTVTIDVGSGDGIKEQMTVVAGQGLVGRVLSVTRSTSTVLLINDPRSAVGGDFVDYNLLGIADGTGAGPLRVTFSSRDPVKKGTVVLTMGSDYAAGVPIGTVTGTSKDPNGNVSTASVVPFVDVHHLDLVGVIVQSQRSGARPPFLPVAPSATTTASPCPGAEPQGPVPTSRPTPRATVTASPTVTPTP